MVYSDPTADTWAYDPAANTWTELKPAGTVPPPRVGRSHGLRSDHPAADPLRRAGADVADATTLVLNDTWAYDPAANTWTELKPAGPLPPARSGTPWSTIPLPGG